MIVFYRLIICLTCCYLLYFKDRNDTDTRGIENKKGLNSMLNLYSVFDKSAAQTAVNTTFYACLSKTKLIVTRELRGQKRPSLESH